MLKGLNLLKKQKYREHAILYSLSCHSYSCLYLWKTSLLFGMIWNLLTTVIYLTITPLYPPRIWFVISIMHTQSAVRFHSNSSRMSPLYYFVPFSQLCSSITLFKPRGAVPLLGTYTTGPSVCPSSFSQLGNNTRFCCYPGSLLRVCSHSPGRYR